MDWDDEATKRLYKDIGGRIRAARTAKGLHQTHLADATGLTRSSIANIEGGRQQFLVHALVLIARTLDVTVDSLLPSEQQLDSLGNVQVPQVDLQGLDDSTQEFVTAAIRRHSGR